MITVPNSAENQRSDATTCRLSEKPPMATRQSTAAAADAVVTTANADPRISETGARSRPSMTIEAAPEPSRPTWLHNITADTAAAATPTSWTAAVRAATSQNRYPVPICAALPATSPAEFSASDRRWGNRTTSERTSGSMTIAQPSHDPDVVPDGEHGEVTDPLRLPGRERQRRPANRCRGRQQ